MKIKRNCNLCGREYFADSRNLKRGWGLCCSKSCAAKLRERSKPGYNPERVRNNNQRRELWNIVRPQIFNDWDTWDAIDDLDGDQWGDMEFGIH